MPVRTFARALPFNSARQWAYNTILGAVPMRPDDLLTWTRATPFVPFRIRLNSVRTFDIRHPEMRRVGRSSANVLTITGEPAAPYERMDMVSLVLIESVEPIELPRTA